MNVTNYQAILFPYAYNILGSVEDAKDIIQEVITKHLTLQDKNIENEKNYLIRSAINMAINYKKRKQKIAREGDVWLPEPLSTEEADTNINAREIISYTLLILLEKLNPKERAVLILKEVFSYSHEDIATFLEETPEHSRKVLSRAKLKINSSEGPTSSRKADEQLMEHYISAIRNRDLHTLENLLSQDITFFADGGGKVKLAASSRNGVSNVATLLLSNYYTYQQQQTARYTVINHQPALLFLESNEIKACQVFELDNHGKIKQINTILDPDKLKNLS